MFGFFKKLREEKERKEKELARLRKEKRCTAKSMGLSIWNLGPGRPMDNSYSFVKKEYDEEKNILTITLDDGDVTCVVYNPVGVHWDGCLPTIQDADKIVWKGHFYGRPIEEYKEKRYVDEFVRIDKTHVKSIRTMPYNNEIKEEVHYIDENTKALSSIPG